MLKFNNVTAIIVSSLGSLFLINIISFLIPYDDPNLEKVFLAFITASLTSYLLRKVSNEPFKNEH